MANYVINKIAECDDGKPKPRKIERIEKFVVHGGQLSTILSTIAGEMEWVKANLLKIGAPDTN